MILTFPSQFIIFQLCIWYFFYLLLLILSVHRNSGFLCLHLFSTTLKVSCQGEQASTKHCIVFSISVDFFLTFLMCTLSCPVYYILYATEQPSENSSLSSLVIKGFKGAAIYVFYLIIHWMPKRSM